MNKINEIVQSWWNVATGDDEIKMIADARKQICDGCPFKQSMMGMDVCGKCHCPIKGKIHSPINSCPENRWSA